MTVRERTQQLECENLSPLASLSSKSRGRERFVEECPLRTVYQRDRDRIIHCKAFRRLKHKTQVFLSPEATISAQGSPIRSRFPRLRAR